MGEVVQGNFDNNSDIPAKQVLECALAKDLDQCLVIGRNKDGKLYVAATTLDASLLVWDMEVTKSRLIYMADHEGDEDE